MAAIVFLTPTRPGFHESPTDAEAKAMAAHFAYLRSCVARGEVVAAGPAEDGSLGLVVFPRAGCEEAREILSRDPAVEAGVMHVEARPWRMSLFGTGSARDWSGFVRAIHLDAAIDAVRTLVTTSAGLERWFLLDARASTADGRRADHDAALPAGGRVEMVWPSTSGPEGVSETNTIHACDATRLRLGWFEDTGWIEIRLMPRAAGGTTVELEQRMPAGTDFVVLENAYVGCKAGWAFYLANLKAVAEHGIDLREPRPDRGDLVNA